MSSAINHMYLPRVSWYVAANQEEAVIFRGDRSGPKKFLRRMKSEALPRANVRRNLRLANSPEASHFAKTVARAIESGWNGGEFDELVLMAEPHFLGILQKTVSVPDRARSYLAKEVSPLSLAGVEAGVRRWRAA